MHRDGDLAAHVHLFELGARCIVHGDEAAVVASLHGPQHRLELATARAAPEAAGDHDRVFRSGHPEAFELVDHGSNGLLAWVDRATGKGETGGLDDNGNPAARRDEVVERRARERVAKCLTDRSRDVP